MEALKRVVLVARNVLDLFLGKDLPNPRNDISNQYK